MLDGFTRWEAARQVRGLNTLLVRVVELDDQHAKAAIYGLNQMGRRPYELEEAWLVRAWCARMACPRARWLSCWAGTRAGSAGTWPCWRSSPSMCGRRWKSVS